MTPGRRATVIESGAVPLQNRVTPRGDIVAGPARGTLMGNRGCLHDEARRIVRRVVGGYRAWVTCVLSFKGRRRRVMTPGRYTELFFLDEATALAAGHRPCGECRRADYQRFKHAWATGNPERGISACARIALLDRELHRDRLGRDGGPRTHQADIGRLPDGVFVADAESASAVLVWRGSLWAWSPEGYTRTGSRPPYGDVIVFTPLSTVNAIAAGYVPMVHATADI